DLAYRGFCGRSHFHKIQIFLRSDTQGFFYWHNPKLLSVGIHHPNLACPNSFVYPQITVNQPPPPVFSGNYYSGKQRQIKTSVISARQIRTRLPLKGLGLLTRTDNPRAARAKPPG